MTPEAARDFPRLPPSEVEWEDLLLRIELMPRALRVTLDELGTGPVGARRHPEEVAATPGPAEGSAPSTRQEATPANGSFAMPGSRDAQRTDHPAVARILSELFATERSAARLRERAAAAAEGASLEQSQLLPVQEDPRDGFERLRRRSFAIVQRRGIEVWGWSAEVEPGRPLTVYQLLSALAASDVATLARLRSTRAEAAAAC